MTASDLLKGSLRLIGVLASGETPEAQESIDALAVLNDLIKSWNIEGLLVYKTTSETFTLTPGQGTRTWGATGDFVSTRPSRIETINYKTSNIETPIEIITAAEWAQITNKIVTGRTAYVYPEGTYPNETLNFWPVPSTADSVVIQSLKPIVGTLALTDTLSFPDGYERALRFNLALDLAPEYGRPVDQMIMQTAMDSKAQLIRKNTKPVYSITDAPGYAKPFNFFTGE